VIDTVISRFGLARMPFGRDLPPSRLHRHRDCGEAAARIAWAVADIGNPRYQNVPNARRETCAA
jgi:type II secretory pathway predicted ATPase ExeA